LQLSRLVRVAACLQIKNACWLPAKYKPYGMHAHAWVGRLGVLALIGL
jgi:hypothetical protein